MNQKNRQECKCGHLEGSHNFQKGVNFWHCRFDACGKFEPVEQPESGQKLKVTILEDRPATQEEIKELERIKHLMAQDKEEGIEKENWHAIEGPNGICACGDKKGNCHERLKKYISQVREEAFREGQKNGKAAYKGQATREAYQRGYSEARRETAIKIVVGLEDFKSTQHEPNCGNVRAAIWGIMKGWGIEPEDIDEYLSKK